jgi:hypothetical protein
VREGSITLDPQECLVVLVENLALQSSGGGGGGGGGGGSAGYNCVGGGCTYVASNGQHSTYSACQSSCGGGSAGYSCLSGNCSYVSSNAQYSSYAACQSTCGGGGSTGKLTFWANQDLGCGYITVTVTSYGSQSLSSYYSSGNPGCGASGCANFNNLAYGAYSYSATSNGCTWNGNVQLSQSCYTLQLTI